MLGPVEFEVVPQAPESRGWVALGASACVHLAIILLLIFGVPISSASAPASATAAPSVQPLAMQPFQARPKVAPRPEPAVRDQPKPPPPTKEIELGPDSKKPDAPAKEAAANKPVPEPAATPPPPPPPPTEPPKPEPQPAAPQNLRIRGPGDYSGTRTIPLPPTSPWGPPKFDAAGGADAAEPLATAAPMGRTGLSNRDPQKWENSFDDETSGRCVEIPDLGKNADGSPVLATVIGRVLDTDGRTPMSGAHLQIVGTAFGTFSDRQGEYRLEFDPKLLARCRKQYVQVVAPGYASQFLTLAIGPRVRSDDVVLRRGR